ncbi:MAG: hypothetical protein JW822_11670 [Spirochaetales bacterium]|nr:hypothetical protein [Spirochaetales bacterium]
MIDWIVAWVKTHKLFVIGITVFSLILLAFSLFMIPVLIINLPKDYFSKPKTKARPSFLHPTVYVLFLIFKNILGVILILLGVVMLVLPGQGIITLLIGLMIIDFPGERKLLIYILKKTKAIKAMNWLREKNSKPPFELPGLN